MANIHTGVGGWTFPPWRGTFYPDGLPHAQELAYAGQRLTVDDATYQRFVDRLDAPPAANPRLHALLHRKAPWEA